MADNVRDFAPYGLDSPATGIELTSNQPNEPPLVLQIGKPVPDHSERVYVRQGGQDDVVIVNAKALSEIPRTATALRTQQVTEIEPALATRIEIKTRTQTFSLRKEAAGWSLSAPRTEKADAISVHSFLTKLDGLQTSEFLESEPSSQSRARSAAHDDQDLADDASPSRRPSPARTNPRFPCELGRYDAIRKTIYARLENDNVILALPDTLVEVLPKNPFSFRDRSISTLKLETGQKVDHQSPRPYRRARAEPRGRAQQMADATADRRARRHHVVTQALAILANLRAEDFVSDSIGDGKPSVSTGPRSKSPGRPTRLTD